MTYKTTASYFLLCELANTKAGKRLSSNRVERASVSCLYRLTSCCCPSAAVSEASK